MTTETLTAFEQGLLESMGQALRGEFGAVHTPEVIAARAAGRPVGSIKAERKQTTTLRLAPAALARWRSSGKGWQTRAAKVLESYELRG